VFGCFEVIVFAFDVIVLRLMLAVAGRSFDFNDFSN